MRAPDRRGLLRSLAVAFAAAGVSVHAAGVTTVAGTAVDAFELTEPGGAKLGEAAKARTQTAVAEGATLGRRRRLPGRGVRFPKLSAIRPKRVGTRPQQPGHEAEIPAP